MFLIVSHSLSKEYWLWNFIICQLIYMDSALITSICHEACSSLSLNTNVHQWVMKSMIRLVSKRGSSWVIWLPWTFLWFFSNYLIFNSFTFLNFIWSINFNANHERTSFFSLKNFTFIWRYVKYCIVTNRLANERDIYCCWQKFVQLSNMINQILLLIRFFRNLNTHIG